MHITTSKDGTAIAYDRVGAGPPLILVDGAFGSRAFGPMPAVASRLAASFSVITFDRRGRGESGGPLPTAVEREIEDLDAVIEAVGGTASLYGFSSGAILAFRAAGRLPDKIAKLALYEPPLAAPDGASPLPETYQEPLARLVADRRYSDAVELFLTQAVGMAGAQVKAMQKSSVWPRLEAAAFSLPADIALQADTGSGKPLRRELTDPIVEAGIPTLLLRGDSSPAWLGRGAAAVAGAIAGAELRTLADQIHDVKADAIAPVLAEFFSA